MKNDIERSIRQSKEIDDNIEDYHKRVNEEIKSKITDVAQKMFINNFTSGIVGYKVDEEGNIKSL